jgi:hypothetical protein
MRRGRIGPHAPLPLHWGHLGFLVIFLFFFSVFFFFSLSVSFFYPAFTFLK